MVSDLERRAASDVNADGSRIIGYAVVFDQPSQDLGGFVEVFEPGAVDRTIRERLDVRALVNHDPNHVLGRTTAGTLKLAKDTRGLRVEIDPPDTTAGRDILASVKRGDVSGMSIAFRVVQGGERFERRADVLTRVISDAVILEASVVTFPAYLTTDAQVAARALQAFQQTQGRRIAWLRQRARI